MRRNLGYTLINILGFSLGLAVFLLISLIVIDDLTFDRFHEDSDRIYRLITTNTASKKVDTITSGALIRQSALEIPEIEAITRVHNFGSVDLTQFGGPESEQGIRRIVVGTDSNFFKVFTSFGILDGNTENPFRQPRTVVVNQEVADAFFPDGNAIGQVVSRDEEDPGMTITGIIPEIPLNSHLQFDVLMPAIVDENNAVWWDSWDNIALYGYVKIQKGVDYKVVEQKIRDVGDRNGLNVQYMPTLQPLLDVHLGSSGHLFDNLNWGKGDRSQVLVLSIVAILTLMIASFNFINLSSARAAKRAREVGMRKVVGARRAHLMVQFLGESVLLTTIAMIIAAITVQITLPHLHEFINKDIALTLVNSPTLVILVFVSAIVVGLLSGLYPAIVLSGFRPILVLKGAFTRTRSGVNLRQVLVVLQFAISIALIASVVIVLQQLKYLGKRDLGFTVDRTAICFMFDREIAPHRSAFMDEIGKLSTVEAVGSSWSVPGNTTYGRFEGRGEDSKTGINSISFVRMQVGTDFIPALDIELIAGRNFSSTHSDSGTGVVINEAALRELGWTRDAIGRRIILLEASGEDVPREVVGIVKNFQYTNARQNIDPLVLEHAPMGGGFILYRIQEGSLEQTTEDVRTIWEEMFPEREFFTQFLDERFERLYRQDQNFASKIAVFSALAVIIASLGLLGLTAFSTEQRRNEIAVRKVLGSSEQKIWLLLTKDFVKWVLIANVIAWPVAYIAMNKWLEEFAFRMNISLIPFLFAGLATSVIAVITISFQAYKASMMNPSDVLRQE